MAAIKPIVLLEIDESTQRNVDGSVFVATEANVSFMISISLYKDSNVISLEIIVESVYNVSKILFVHNSFVLF